MTEKVIGEIRLIESDDGFRIEIKGDKEQLKEMGWGPGMIRSRSQGKGRGHSRKRFWRDKWRGHKHARSHIFGFGHGCGPTHAGSGPWWDWEDDETEESGAYEKPPKNV